MLLPYQSLDYTTATGKVLLTYHMLGAALFNSLVGAITAQFAIGTGFIFAMWGLAGCLAAPAVVKGLTLHAMLTVMLVCAWPIFTSAESALVFGIVMMGRMSLTGHLFIGLGDVVVGILLGLGVASCSGGIVGPMFRTVLGKHSKRLAATLTIVAIAIAAIASLQVFPYSQPMPKRVLINHFHYTESLGSQQGVSSSNSRQQRIAMTVKNATWAVAGADGNPVDWVVPRLGFDPATAVHASGREWQIVYPVSSILDVRGFKSPAVETGMVQQLPYVRLVSDSMSDSSNQSKQHGDSSTPPWREIQLEVYTEAPCWGVLNFTGPPILNWSLSATLNPQLSHTSAQVTLEQHVVRWTTEASHTSWPITLQVAHSGATDNQKLHVELHVAYLTRTSSLQQMVSKLPDWSTLSYEATTYYSEWQF